MVKLENYNQVIVSWNNDEFPGSSAGKFIWAPSGRRVTMSKVPAADSDVEPQSNYIFVKVEYESGKPRLSKHRQKTKETFPVTWTKDKPYSAAPECSCRMNKADLSLHMNDAQK